MKNKGIIIFLVILGLVIVVLIVGDFISTRPENQTANPYKYDVDEFKGVDAKLIKFRETRNFQIGMDSLKGIAYDNGHIFIGGSHKLQVIDKTGKLINEISLDGIPSCVHIKDGRIFIGMGSYIIIYSTGGELVSTWQPFNENSVITSIATKGDVIFIADAGKRIVYRYTMDGKKTGEFEGKAGDEAIHGFIVPSPYFDLAVNGDGELWVVNPGNHSLENYTFDGILRGFWKKSSLNIEGFSGCCNPAHFAFMPDGNFLTSEKGMVRIKIYKPSGELDCVVAPPSKFTEDGHAPDVAVDEEGTVYALDQDRKMVRVFDRIEM